MPVPGTYVNCTLLQDDLDAVGQDVTMTMMVVFEEANMNEKMNVAEAKKKFSELLARTAYNGERFIINRRGKPMAVLIGLEDFALLEEQIHSSEPPPKACWPLLGHWRVLRILKRL